MGDDTPKAKRSGKAETGRDRAFAPPERKARGFLRAAELTPSAMKSAGAKRGFAELRLLTEWRAVVGDALCDVCRPVKVSYGGRGGVGLGATLVVTAEGARAPEIEMQKTAIIERVNAFYGYRAVSRLAIDQARAPMMGASNASSEDGRGASDQARVAPRPASGVADEALALALGRLEANIKSKAARESAAAKPSDHARSDP